MAVGDCQRAFGPAAEKDGLRLGPSRVPWINQRGHFGLPPECDDVIPLLEAIFVEMGGDPVVQSAKRPTPLTGDFVEQRTGALIEIDEQQHFTSFRAASLGLYPTEVRLGFERALYLDLCRELAPRSDRYRATKGAIGFGPGGRQRQRAYYDALRDLAAPACGRPPVIRVPVLDGDGAGAYRRERDRIRHLLDDAGTPPTMDRDESVPDLATAVAELRSLLRSFDMVEPGAMDERFYVDGFNELDLAGRTIIEAFDRDRGPRGAC